MLAQLRLRNLASLDRSIIAANFACSILKKYL